MPGTQRDMKGQRKQRNANGYQQKRNKRLEIPIYMTNTHHQPFPQVLTPILVNSGKVLKFLSPFT